ENRPEAEEEDRVPEGDERQVRGPRRAQRKRRRDDEKCQRAGDPSRRSDGKRRVEDERRVKHVVERTMRVEKCGSGEERNRGAARGAHECFERDRLTLRHKCERMREQERQRLRRCEKTKRGGNPLK